jgi:RNA polymerase sigma-70 factor (ECF subfamily)
LHSKGPEFDPTDLVRRIQAEIPHGTASFRELVTIYTPRIRQRALRMVGNPADADEIVQDVLLRVFRSIRRFELDKPLQNWLYAITSNSSKNLLRTRARDRRRTEEFTEHAKIQNQPDRNRDAMIGHSLDEALDELDPDSRVAIILRFVEGYTFPEIAEELELGESATKMKVRRGIQQLRTTLRRGTEESA